MALMACCYLLLRRGNAFAPDITPPVRLRHWSVALLAILAMSHIWYLPIVFLTSSEDIKMVDLVGGLLDSMTLLPVAIIVFITMLQDRRRPLWPVAVMIAPVVAGGVYGVVTLSYALLPVLYVYALMMCVGLFIYMIRALKQYGRWLRDNYADLEHKEVWQSFLVLAIILLTFGIYAFTGKGPVYQYAMQVITAILICFLLWRVETLQQLSENTSSTAAEMPAIPASIGPLLKKRCENGQLYLQNDLTLTQLAHAIGTNRTYLGQYFAQQGITYNAYINGLRVNHFVRLYHEAVADQRIFTAQQLAFQSGFHSYSTFSSTFKQNMGMTVTQWMHSVAE